MVKVTKRALEMRRVVEEYEKSGQRRGAFCGQRGIALTTFDYWRRELGAKPRIVKVEVSASEPVGHFTLAFSNGRRIESSWRYAEGELARLIRIVESA